MPGSVPASSSESFPLFDVRLAATYPVALSTNSAVYVSTTTPSADADTRSCDDGEGAAGGVAGVACFPHPFANRVTPARIVNTVAENCGNFSHSRLANDAGIIVCASP